ncbi:MAG: hypothetical protein KatS3mg077_1639 [Candidatus Binatia bacterium]|nr:MAG: hypothetical protein KatS3mg077_1639 [Candidatus Binatia bacterium]
MGNAAAAAFRQACLSLSIAHCERSSVTHVVCSRLPAGSNAHSSLLVAKPPARARYASQRWMSHFYYFVWFLG